MKYYKTIVSEDTELQKEVVKLNDFANFSGIKQPYLHKVWNNEYIISEKQYNRIKSLIIQYIKQKPQKLAS